MKRVEREHKSPRDEHFRHEREREREKHLSLSSILFNIILFSLLKKYFY